MQGSVTKRKRTRKDGTSYICFRAQVRRPDGKGNIERTFSAPEFMGIANAREAANRWVRQQVTAITESKWHDPAAGKVSLGDVAEEYMTRMSSKSPKTRRDSRYILNRHILPRWKNTRVDAITAADVQQWVDELAETRAPQTCANIYGVLRALLKLAVARGYLQAPPATPELPSKRSGARQLFLEAHELHALLSHLPEHWRTAVWLDALTGLRAGELWGLTRADVDLLHNELHVRRAVKDIGGSLEIGSPKTAAGERKLSIPGEALPDLRAQLEAPALRHRGIRGGPKGYAAVVESKQSSEGLLGYVPDAHDPRRLLFVTPSGHPITQGNFYTRIFRPAVRAAVAAGDLPKSKAGFRFHDIRHTAASFALQAAGNVEAALVTVQQRLGHKDIATTINVYGHLTRAADQQVAEGISAIVKRKSVGER